MAFLLVLTVAEFDRQRPVAFDFARNLRATILASAEKAGNTLAQEFDPPSALHTCWTVRSPPSETHGSRVEKRSPAVRTVLTLMSAARASAASWRSSAISY